MCTGYRAEQIESEFGDGAGLGVRIAYSKEDAPLGTAGALRLAEKHLGDSEDFLALNGDSFIDMDFGALMRYHLEHGGVATIVVRRVDDAARYGTVEIGPVGRVAAFVEKTGRHASGLINAGVYLFRRELMRYIPEGAASLETDVFPAALDAGIYALEQGGVFIDIGTPEDYAHAQEIADRLKQAATLIP